MIYLLSAYTFFWVLLFFYILHLRKSMDKLSKDLEFLKNLMKKNNNKLEKGNNSLLQNQLSNLADKKGRE